MNIFALSDNPKQAAEWHVDRHVVKMPLEYAQLLSTAHCVLDDNQVGYAATHINHPSARWARLSAHNYTWLYHLFYYTALEYKFRYGRDHKSFVDLSDPLSHLPEHIPLDVPFTLPTPAMPDEFKVPGDVVQSYRNYYRDGKAHLHKWSCRLRPEWCKDY